MAKPKRGTDGPVRAAGGGKQPKRKHVLRRVVLTCLITLVSLGLIGAGVVAYAYTTIKIPDANTDFKTNTTFIYYGDGRTELGSFQVQNRTSIPYEQMPQYVKDAIVAAENRTFWDDPGISVPGLLRATLGLVGFQASDNTATGGGSTITQQYIKIMFLTQERTFARKATELLLAAKIGQSMSKQAILEGYLNTVYFGRGSYGIEAAAQAYFGKPAAKLSLAQSVALAAIVNSPGNLDPANGEKQAADLLERYQYTLNGMVEMGKITAEQKAKIYTQLPKFAKVRDDSRMGGPKGFLLDMVRQELLAKGFTDEEITGGGLKVVTTFDKADQDAVVASAQRNALIAAGGNKKKAADLHPGIASIDNATGGVLALYGGPDYVKNYLNWATTARPTGSSFKPYALLAGLRNGWTLSDKLNGNSFTPPGDRNPVRNDRNYGRITLQNATTHSVNSAFVDLVMQIPNGPEQVRQAAIDAGLPADKNWDMGIGDRIALGNTEVSPLNQAAAYSTFANLGQRRSPHVVAEVLDSTGKSVYTADTTGSQTIAEDDANDVTYALTKVTQDGTGYRAAQLGYPVAGKTGTVGVPVKVKTAYGSRTERQTRAIWFVGYTKQVTTAVVYVKGKAGTSDLGHVFGATWPLSTWLDYMKVAMDGKERISFDPPTRRHSTQSPKPDSNKTKNPPPATSAPAVPSEPPATSAPPTSAPPTSAPPTSAPPTATSTASQ